MHFGNSQPGTFDHSQLEMADVLVGYLYFVQVMVGVVWLCAIIQRRLNRLGITSGRFFWLVSYAQLAIVIVLAFVRAQIISSIAAGPGSEKFDSSELVRLISTARHVEVVPSLQCDGDARRARLLARASSRGAARAGGMGWSAMHRSTSASQACGSMLLSLALAISVHIEAARSPLARCRRRTRHPAKPVRAYGSRLCLKTFKRALPAKHCRRSSISTSTN
jgi:hypothetical protein